MAIWSPDSRRFVSCRIDQRLAQYLHLVQSVPKDTTWPRLHSYAYPLPGDEAVPQAEACCFGVSGEEPAAAAAAADALLRVAAQSELALVAGRRPGLLLTRDRGYLGYRLHEIDTATGRRRGTWWKSARNVLSIPTSSGQAVGHRVIADGAQVICMRAKRRLGSPLPVRHQTGALLRQLTAGLRGTSPRSSLTKMAGGSTSRLWAARR